MLIELVRLGRDSSVKTIEGSGTSVANLACAYDVGYGDKKTTQWLDLAVFGKQAEALAPYFTKGRQFMITAKDVSVEEYEKKDGGLGARLKAVAVDLKFAGGREEQGQATSTGFGAQQVQNSPQFQQPVNTQPQQQQVQQPQYPQGMQPQPTSMQPPPMPQGMGQQGVDSDIPF